MPGNKITLVFYASKYWHLSILLIRTIKFSSQILAILLNTKHSGHRDLENRQDMQSEVKSICCKHFGHYSSSSAPQFNIPLIPHARNTSNRITDRRIPMEAKAENNLPTVTHTQTHAQNNIIKRVGGMPWEPTGVCLWVRRGQV